jgi:hypothetical protein
MTTMLFPSSSPSLPVSLSRALCLPPMRSRRKGLAASFVMTFAAGCDAKGSAPAAAPTVDVLPPGTTAAPTVSTSGAPEAAAVASAAPSTTAVATGSDRTTLPPAPSTGHVMRNADGSCTWFADVQCPRTATGHVIPCNPPPPHLVRCPGDGGA